MSQKDQSSNPIPHLKRVSVVMKRPHTTPGSSKQMNPDITWGMLKQLQQRAEILMHGAGVASTLENTFLAYLAIVLQSLGSDQAPALAGQEVCHQT
uniref:Uncharacterized protein n=1 Tax=Malurus cyaneus samueli TaxID=2593467 RepID=A0A8C5TMG3_9PASS